MDGDDWLADYFDPAAWEAEEEYQAELAAAHQPPPKGGRRQVEVICCEGCQSTDVRPIRRLADRGRSDWTCRSCGAAWVEVDTVGIRRAYIP